MTDEFTDKYLRSVFQTLTDKVTDGMCPSVNHTIADRINPSVYFKWETSFFGAQNSSIKPLANVFFRVANRYNNGMWNYRRKES